MKYLLLLIVLVLIWRHWLKRKTAQGPAAKPVSPKPAEKMLTCAVCKLHMPESEAILEAGQAFCCEAHRVEAGRPAVPPRS